MKGNIIKNKILVIIPAFNEAKNIKLVIDRIEKESLNLDYLIINDCSSDNTEEICIQNNLCYISLPCNLGIGGAIQAGYKYALENKYEIVIQHDGDGQHDPKYLKDVIEPISQGKADVVIGSRFLNNIGFQSSRVRRIGINFLSVLIKLSAHILIKDVTSGYRAVNKKFIRLYAIDYAQDFPEPEAIMSAALNGAVIQEVPVVMSERTYGKSSINALKSIYYMIKVSLSIMIYRLMFIRSKSIERIDYE